MSNLDVEIEHDKKELEPQVGTLWTNGDDVYLLAQVGCESGPPYGGDILYSAISLNTANRWCDPTTDISGAVDGLDPFEGRVALSQYLSR